MPPSFLKSAMALLNCNLRIPTCFIQLFGTTGKYYVIRVNKSETKDIYTKQ
jgi:hypothetical protein